MKVNGADTHDEPVGDDFAIFDSLAEKKRARSQTKKPVIDKTLQESLDQE